MQDYGLLLASYEGTNLTGGVGTVWCIAAGKIRWGVGGSCDVPYGRLITVDKNVDI